MLKPLHSSAVAFAAVLASALAAPILAADFKFQPVGYPYATDVASAAALSNGRVIAAPLASGPWSLQYNGFALTRLSADGIEGMLDIQEVNEGVIALARPYRPVSLYESIGYYQEAWQRAGEGQSYFVRSTDGGASWQRLSEPGFPNIPGTNWFDENVGDQRGHLPRLVAISDGRAVLSDPAYSGGIWRRQSSQWIQQPALPSPSCVQRHPSVVTLSMSAAGEVLTNDSCANLVIQAQPSGAFVSGGVTNVRAISRQQGAHLYVATTTHVYRRDGNSFVRVSALPAAIASAFSSAPAGLVLDTLADGTVVLAIQNELFASRDRGLTWTLTPIQPDSSKDDIKQVVGRTANAAYVVTPRSIDRYDLTGATAPIPTRKPLAPAYVALKSTLAGAPVAISDTNITYRSGYAWKSLDAAPGLSFLDASFAPDGTAFATMHPDSAIGLDAPPLNTLLFRRAPSSTTWTELSSFRTARAAKIEALTATQLVAYGFDGVAWSADGGATWADAMEIEIDGSVYNPLFDIRHVYVASATTVYALDGYRMFRSTDGGRTFATAYHLDYPGMTDCRQLIVALNEAAVCATPEGVVTASSILSPASKGEPEVRDVVYSIRTVEANPRHFLEALAINSSGELLIMGPFGSKLASPFTGAPTDAWTTIIEQPFMTKIQFPRAVGTADDFHVVRDGSGIQRLNR
jgi:hypothetical protein